jgi:hypothetical protein
MVAGVPTSVLVKRYGAALCPSPDGESHAYHAILTESLSALRRAGIGSFRCLHEDPGFHEVPLPVVPAAVNQMTWDKVTGSGSGTGDNSHLVFVLPKPQFISGVRIRYSHRNREGTHPLFRVLWEKKGGAEAPLKPLDGPQPHEPSRMLRPFSALRIPVINLARANRYLHLEHRPQPEDQSVTIWLCATVDQLRIYPDNKAFTLHISAIVLLLPVSEAQVPPGPGGRASALSCSDLFGG